MKTFFLFILAAITLLLPACNPIEGYRSCSGGPIIYYEDNKNGVNYISDILCKYNNLCGKKENIDLSKEGETLKVGSNSFVFHIKENDTLPLGIEHNKFYVSAIGYNAELPLLYPINSTYRFFSSLRMAIDKDIAPEEKENIYRLISTATHSGSIITGKIRFYRSKDDPYFDSEYDFLPEIVISNAEDILLY